jgi:hypothetical protein
MKKAGLILMFFVFILVFSTSINAQQKPQTILQGTDLIVPFSTTIVDSTNWIKLEKESLMKVERLMCKNKDYQIISFSFVVALSGDMVITKSSGNMFTPEMKKEINNLKSNARIWIEEISCKGPDGKDVKLQDVLIKIK